MIDKTSNLPYNGINVCSVLIPNYSIISVQLLFPPNKSTLSK